MSIQHHNPLQKAFLQCFEASRNPVSSRMLQELQNKTLMLIDFEITSEDIPHICRFLVSQQCAKYLETIILLRKLPFANASEEYSLNQKRNSKRPNSLQLMFHSVIEFIGNAQRLKTIRIESVSLTLDLVPAFSAALAKSKSPLNWLGLAHCRLGNDGLRLMTQTLAQLPRLQVLALEDCGLSDESLPYLTSILKFHQSQLDERIWTLNLRDPPSASPSSEVSQVLSSRGLLALGLNGNRFTLSHSPSVVPFLRCLKLNTYLLGLNLAHNQIDLPGITHLVHAFSPSSKRQKHRSPDSSLALHPALAQGNQSGREALISAGIHHVLHALPIGGNPGLTPDLALLARNTTQTIHSSFSSPSHSYSEESLPSSRLRIYSPQVQGLIERWQQLQDQETTRIVEESMRREAVELNHAQDLPTDGESRPPRLPSDPQPAPLASDTRSPRQVRLPSPSSFLQRQTESSSDLEDLDGLRGGEDGFASDDEESDYSNESQDGRGGRRDLEDEPSLGSDELDPTYDDLSRGYEGYEDDLEEEQNPRNASSHLHSHLLPHRRPSFESPRDSSPLQFHPPKGTFDRPLETDPPRRPPRPERSSLDMRGRGADSPPSRRISPSVHSSFPFSSKPPSFSSTLHQSSRRRSYESPSHATSSNNRNHPSHRSPRSSLANLSASFPHLSLSELRELDLLRSTSRLDLRDDQDLLAFLSAVANRGPRRSPTKVGFAGAALKARKFTPPPTLRRASSSTPTRLRPSTSFSHIQSTASSRGKSSFPLGTSRSSTSYSPRKSPSRASQRPSTPSRFSSHERPRPHPSRHAWEEPPSFPAHSRRRSQPDSDHFFDRIKTRLGLLAPSPIPSPLRERPTKSPSKASRVTPRRRSEPALSVGPEGGGRRDGMRGRDRDRSRASPSKRSTRIKERSRSRSAEPSPPSSSSSSNPSHPQTHMTPLPTPPSTSSFPLPPPPTQSSSPNPNLLFHPSLPPSYLLHHQQPHPSSLHPPQHPYHQPQPPNSDQFVPSTPSSFPPSTPSRFPATPESPAAQYLDQLTSNLLNASSIFERATKQLTDATQNLSLLSRPSQLPSSSLSLPSTLEKHEDSFLSRSSLPSSLPSRPSSSLLLDSSVPRGRYQASEDQNHMLREQEREEDREEDSVDLDAMIHSSLHSQLQALLDSALQTVAQEQLTSRNSLPR